MSSQGFGGVERVDHQAHDGLISVIIPVRGDPLGLRATLDSLMRTCPQSTRFEVIVANDGGDLKTRRVAEGFTHVVTYDLIPNRGPAAARNAAIANASGSVVAFLDANVTVLPGWWGAMRSATAKTDMVAGRVVIDPRDIRGFWDRYDSVSAFNIESYVRKKHAATCNLAVRREVLDRVGGFDERFRSGEDTEFTRRALDQGARLEYSDAMAIYHPARSTRAQFGKLYRIVVGRVELAEAFPARFGKYRLSPRLALSLLTPPRSLAAPRGQLAAYGSGTITGFYLARYASNLYTLGCYTYVSCVGTRGRKHDLS